MKEVYRYEGRYHTSVVYEAWNFEGYTVKVDGDLIIWHPLDIDYAIDLAEWYADNE